jgi:trans-aconitate methyltransferase
MSQVEEFGSNYAAGQINRRQNVLRRFIKSFYVSRILKHVDGLAVDLGCGAGQILERLPHGSLGIEVNPFLVADLKQRGHQVVEAKPDAIRLDVSGVPAEKFKTLVLSHVLEHFNQADQVLRRLLSDCAERGISTVIVVVPGQVGYRSDSTHKTFVTLEYLKEKDLLTTKDFLMTYSSYFPGNFKFIGEYFIYHELMLVYTRKKVKIS